MNRFSLIIRLKNGNSYPLEFITAYPVYSLYAGNENHPSIKNVIDDQIELKLRNKSIAKTEIQNYTYEVTDLRPSSLPELLRYAEVHIWACKNTRDRVDRLILLLDSEIQRCNVDIANNETVPDSLLINLTAAAQYIKEGGENRSENEALKNLIDKFIQHDLDRIQTRTGSVVKLPPNQNPKRRDD